jgi:hypothetical protein
MAEAYTSRRSVGEFINQIVVQSGGQSNPTLYNFNCSIKQPLATHLQGFGITRDDWNTKSNWDFLCNEIQIPGLTFTTTDIRSYHKGKNIKVPAAKVFNEFDVSFYCDTTAIPYRFFRGWMDFISGFSETPAYTTQLANNTGGYDTIPTRFYNDIAQDLTIYKIEKNGPSGKAKTLQYWTPYAVSLKNAYPFSMSSIPLSSASANGLVKVTVGVYYEMSNPFIP